MSEKRYEKFFKEANDLDELIGYLKGKYGKVSDAQKDEKFKKLSASDKEYVLDELKSDMK